MRYRPIRGHEIKFFILVSFGDMILGPQGKNSNQQCRCNIKKPAKPEDMRIGNHI